MKKDNWVQKIVCLKENMGELVAGELAIVTADLPDDNVFAVHFGRNRRLQNNVPAWISMGQADKERFEIVEETTEHSKTLTEWWNTVIKAWEKQLKERSKNE